MKNTRKFIILMYHDLDSKYDPSKKIKKGDLLYVIDVHNFEYQMKYLYSNRFQVTTLDEIFNSFNISNNANYQHGQTIGTSRTINYSPFTINSSKLIQSPNNPMAPVLTFDDGHITNYTRGFPILKKYKFRAHFFITIKWIGKPNYMSLKQIKELSDYGMVIGSHGVTHRYLDDLKRDEIFWELKESKEALEDITGRQIHHFSCPGGRITNVAKKLAKELGYITICTSQPGYNITDKHAFTLKRLAIKKNISFKYYKGMIDGQFDRLDIIKFYLINRCKRLLGNTLYEKVRETLLNIR